MKGLSIKSIFWSVFSQIIIFFYLLDNDTSFLILLSSGIGILIESWKITKAVNVSVLFFFFFFFVILIILIISLFNL